MIERDTLWIVIIGLGIGSYGLRFAFIGLVGNRQMPDWMLRHLRYTAVAILPALVAPQVLWPSGTDGQPDLPRMAAAIATVAVGYVTKNVFLALGSGLATLYSALYLMG
ncbi:MAG: AzlD domain-containing protein [Sulfitobacter sp.]